MEFRRNLDPKKGLDIGHDSSPAREKRQEEFAKAVKAVTNGISKDEELKYAYQSNIAMCFLDEEHYYKKETGKRYLNKKDRHEIANRAALSFLDFWCSYANGI